ncbi:MAG: hypothetical protein FJZ01_13485 [Candidatus Sericytochromatia bacterium]|nr:hypothetical protein [Candidatus Tanganyikabacteria bacterium]
MLPIPRAEVLAGTAAVTLVLPEGADGPARVRKAAALQPSQAYRVTVAAHDLAAPVSAVATGAADALSIEVGNVPAGTNRLLTVTALDSGGNPIAPATWRAVATVAAVRQRIGLSASSTAVGAVWARWLEAGRKDLAGAHDPSAVARRLDQIKDAGRLPHHAFVDAGKYADLAATAGSLDVGTSGLAVAPAAIDLTIEGAPHRAAADVWADDPASPLQSGLAPDISQTPGRYLVAPILPGTWTVRASIPGLGVVSEPVTLGAGATVSVKLAFPAWQPGPELPAGLGNAVAASDGTRIYVVGGIVPSTGTSGGVPTSGTATGSVLLLDTSKTPLAWQRLPDLPTPRESGVAAIFDGRLYVIGGLAGNSTFYDAFALDLGNPVAWTVLPQPTAFDLTCRQGRCPDPGVPVGAFEDKGGLALLWTVYDDSPFAPFAAGRSHRFDPRDSKWAKDPADLPPMRTPRRLTTAAVLGDLVMIAGGDREEVAEGTAYPKSSSFSLPTVEAFDKAARRWTTWPDMPTGRSECAVAAASGSFFVAGGVDHLNVPLTVVERFDVAKRAWLPAPPLREARSAFPLVHAGGKLWAIGGSPSRTALRKSHLNFGGLALKSVETLSVGALP